MNRVSTADGYMDAPIWTRMSDIAWRYLKLEHLDRGWDRAKRRAVSALRFMSSDQLHHTDLSNTVIATAWLYHVIPRLDSTMYGDMWSELQPLIGEWDVINGIDDLERIIEWADTDRVGADTTLGTTKLQICRIVGDADRFTRTGRYGWDCIAVRCAVDALGSEKNAANIFDRIIECCQIVLQIPDHMHTAEARKLVVPLHAEFLQLYQMAKATRTG